MTLPLLDPTARNGWQFIADDSPAVPAASHMEMRFASVGPSLVYYPTNADGIGWPPRFIRESNRNMKVWGALAAVSAVAGAYYVAKRNDSFIGGIGGAFVGGLLPVIGPLWLRRR